MPYVLRCHEIRRQRLPVVLEMATDFSKEKYNLDRPFACRPQIKKIKKIKKQNPKLKPNYIQSHIEALLKSDSLVCLIQAHA